MTSAPGLDVSRSVVRELRAEELARFERVVELAFGETLSDAVRELERSVIELDRSIGAYEDGELVGTASIYTLAMSVPGGLRPVAGVTLVAVLPTHRRRGHLSRMMRAQLHELHAQQREPVAALWASEPGIYGRFGYGAASRVLSLTIPRSPRALLAEPADPALRPRLVDPGDALAECEQVRRSDLLARPGMFARDERWQRRAIFDDPGGRAGKSALRCVLLADDTGPRAYARFATERSWGSAGPSGIVHVQEAHASDPAAYAQLWRWLTDLDLTAEVRVPFRPLDDPLLELFVDVRRSMPTLHPNLFVRLVDLDRALTTRTYAVDVDVVLEVSDPLCPWNAGRWRLAGDPTGATLARTSDAADLALSATELGAVYLGGSSLTVLAAAGRVEELRRGALPAATRALRADPLPYCPEVF